MADNEQEYWLTAPKEEVGELAMERIRGYRDYMKSSGRLGQLRELYMAYHGVAEDRSSDALTAAGTQGELTKAKLNAFRSLLQNALTLVTSDRPAAYCRAANNDSSAFEEAMLGNGIVEDYMKQRGLDAQLRYAVETALSLRKSFFFCDWDFDRGEKVAVEEAQRADGSTYQNILRQGDATFKVKNLSEVAFDPYLSTYDLLPWIAYCENMNKWDLAARFKNDPELQQRIISMDAGWAKRAEYGIIQDVALLSYPTDLIPVWKLYADKTAALQDGRVLLMLEDGTVLFDDPLPFDEIPVRECDPSAELMRRFGYTPSIDALGLQDAVDGGISSIITNLLSQAANTIWSKPGQNVDVQELSNGMRHLQSEVKPEAIQLNQLPPHAIEVLKLLLSFMEQQFNLNSTARGVPPSANMSGASMALLQSIAIKLSSGLQGSYVRLIEGVCNLLFQMLQKFANTERVLDVAGVGNRYVVKRWSKENIGKIRKVVVEVGSALAQVESGRLEIARDLKEMGELKTSADYFSVIATGRLQSATSPTEKMIALVAAENEMIARGEVPPVLPSDDPVYHMLHHPAAVADPEARQDPKVVSAYSQHYLKHLEDARTMDPLLAAILKLALPPQLIGQPPAGEAPAQGGAPGGNPPAGGGAPGLGSAPVSDPKSAIEKAGDAVRKPEMPINPLSGKRWDPGTGGMPDAA